MIKIENLTKRFGERIAVAGIDLEIKRGEIFGLLGPNGAGKTTLMKILTGMISKTSGQVIFDNHEWSRKDLKNIGSLIENAPLYGNLTAQENLKVITKVRGVDDSVISNILNTIGLTNTGHKLSKDFSLGMKERLGIGLALVGEPKLLILDEPTNGLDPVGIQQLRNLIAEFKNKDITIIISSHMLSEVEHLADTIGIIGGGKLLLEKPYDHQENLEKLFNDTLEKAGVLNV